MAYLADTNVISELRKTNANPHVRAWSAATPGPDIYLSTMTIGELRLGAVRIRRKDPAHAALLDAFLTQVKRDYDGRIVPVTLEIAEVWAEINVPDPLPIADGLIAATAKVHGWTVVTRNIADFERTGVAILNPFEPPATN